MTALAQAVPAQIEAHVAFVERQKRRQAAVIKYRKAKAKTEERVWTEQHNAHVVARVNLLLNLHNAIKLVKADETECVCDDVQVSATGLIKAFFATCPLKKNIIFSSRRNIQAVYWRQALMHLLYSETNLSLPQIGRMMGGRDHTTILHGVRTVNQAIEAGNYFERQLITGHTLYIRRKAT